MKLRLRLLLAGILLAGLCTAWMVVSLAEDPDSNWPQWRGPGGQGIFEDHKLPLEWDTARNLHWKAAIPGKGHSSPVIWGDKIFLTAAIQGSKLEKPTAIKIVPGVIRIGHPAASAIATATPTPQTMPPVPPRTVSVIASIRN